MRAAGATWLKAVLLLITPLALAACAEESGTLLGHRAAARAEREPRGAASDAAFWLPATAVPARATALPLSPATPLPSATVPPSPTPDPFLAAGAPVLLEIPAIGVVAAVEQVGLNGDGAMAVPTGWMNVAWYHLGFRPGEAGNAVMAGHLDTNSGSPAVFWALDQVQPGDDVAVTYENGDRYTFTVEGSEFYDHDAEGPIIDRIFGESLTSDLNLITCDGAWDHGQATYSHRLVVFATLAPERTVRLGDQLPAVE